MLEDPGSRVEKYGTVTPEGFELHRGTRVRAGSHPVLTGTFSPFGEGTRVEYRLGRSKPNQPYMRIAAIIWAVMALSWVIFFAYWLVDPDGIDIGLPRLLLLLGIVVLMGATIAAGRRTYEEGGAELLDVVKNALAPAELIQTANSATPDGLEEQ